MDTEKKAGLAINIIVTMILFAVAIYLGIHFYGAGYEKGYRTGYSKGHRSASSSNDIQAQWDRDEINDKLDDIDSKLSDAEWERRLHGGER